MKSLVLIGSLYLLTACGGGDSSAPSSSPALSATVDADLPEESSKSTMQELIIPDGFDFSSLNQLTLTVDLDEFSTERSFISLYSDYTTETLQPVYSSKITTAELSGGKATISFVLSSAELPVIAEVQGLSSKKKIQEVFLFSAKSEVWQK